MKALAIIALATVIAAPAFAQSSTRHFARAQAQAQARAQQQQQQQQQQRQQQTQRQSSNPSNDAYISRLIREEWNQDNVDGD